MNESLPARWAERNETARPYGESTTLKHQIEFRRIRIVCLPTILLKLGDIYYHHDAFEPVGLTSRFKQLRIGWRDLPFGERAKKIALAQPDCALWHCSRHNLAPT
jgi:hypothetical protein